MDALKAPALRTLIEAAERKVQERRDAQGA